MPLGSESSLNRRAARNPYSVGTEHPSESAQVPFFGMGGSADGLGASWYHRRRAVLTDRTRSLVGKGVSLAIKWDPSF